jgi:ABC-type multidrug transport system fused ATPase/permease subunit
MHQRQAAPKRRLKATNIRRYLRELVWPRRRLFLIGLLLIFVNRGAGLVVPGSTKYLIDEVIQKGRRELILPLAGVVGIAVIIQAVSSLVLTYVLSASAYRMIADLRIRVQQHIGRLPIRFYDANKTGALISRIMSDVEGVRNLVGTGLIEFIGGIVTALIAFVLLLRIHVMLTLLALSFMVGFFLILQKAYSWIRPIYRERGRITAEVTARLAESLSGVRVVKGFHAEAREAAVFEAGAFRIFENARRTVTSGAILMCAATILMGLVSVSVILIGGPMILSGTLTIGDFFAFSLYLAFMVMPMLQSAAVGSQLTEAFAGLDRMHEVLQEPPEDVDSERVVNVDRIRGQIEFDNVTFEYEPGKPVLRNVTLRAVPGTVTALVGSSGSGKSTLISLVAAFTKPTSGTVLIDGVSLSTVTLDSYRSQLGVVLQETFLFDGSIKENVAFGRPAASDEEVLRAATIARVDEFAFKLERGLDTVVGERGVRLSGGQRQRVAIARAILADPRILILDEATSSLDTESEALIQEGLAALMAGRTTFVIAHRLSTIVSADQILVLENGEIVERGSHSELLARGGRYMELYSRQAGIEANQFVNPGERAAEPETAEVDKVNERESIGEVAQDLWGFRTPR